MARPSSGIPTVPKTADLRAPSSLPIVLPTNVTKSGHDKLAEELLGMWNARERERAQFDHKIAAKVRKQEFLDEDLSRPNFGKPAPPKPALVAQPSSRPGSAASASASVPKKPVPGYAMPKGQPKEHKTFPFKGPEEPRGPKEASYATKPVTMRCLSSGQVVPLYVAK